MESISKLLNSKEHELTRTQMRTFNISRITILNNLRTKFLEVAEEDLPKALRCLQNSSLFSNEMCKFYWEYMATVKLESRWRDIYSTEKGHEAEKKTFSMFFDNFESKL